ncbi:MAG: cytochrome c, partial [Methylococcales bacterium]|nr:cytochrome c [Methylococcales bacterium]
MTDIPWWVSESFWKKIAIWVTAGAFVILIFLTFDSLSQTSAGTRRVPAYTVINQQLDYRKNDQTGRFQPVIGDSQPLFGKVYSAAEAEALVDLGKKTVQAKNC